MGFGLPRTVPARSPHGSPHDVPHDPSNNWAQGQQMQKHEKHIFVPLCYVLFQFVFFMFRVVFVCLLWFSLFWCHCMCFVTIWCVLLRFGAICVCCCAVLCFGAWCCVLICFGRLVESWVLLSIFGSQVEGNRNSLMDFLIQAELVVSVIYCHNAM